MSQMEDLQPQLDEHARREARFADAVASMKVVETRKAARGHAVMAMAMGYGNGALGTGTFGRISHYAKLFCIGFAMLAPSLLIWQVLL